MGGGFCKLGWSWMPGCRPAEPGAFPLIRARVPCGRLVKYPGPRPCPSACGQACGQPWAQTCGADTQRKQPGGPDVVIQCIMCMVDLVVNRMVRMAQSGCTHCSSSRGHFGGQKNCFVESTVESTRLLGHNGCGGRPGVADSPILRVSFYYLSFAELWTNLDVQ